MFVWKKQFSYAQILNYKYKTIRSFTRDKVSVLEVDRDTRRFLTEEFDRLNITPPYLEMDFDL